MLNCIINILNSCESGATKTRRDGKSTPVIPRKKKDNNKKITKNKGQTTQKITKNRKKSKNWDLVSIANNCRIGKGYQL